MEIICINCGQTCEVDEEPSPGQHLLCPFCDVKFSYTPQNMAVDKANSISSTAEETQGDEASARITISCPHCGATYDVDADYIGETATCGTCDREFLVTGTQTPETREVRSSGRAVAGIGVSEDACKAKQDKVPRFAKVKVAFAHMAVHTLSSVKSFPRLIGRVVGKVAIKFRYGRERLYEMAAVRCSENVRYRRRKNNFVIVITVVIAVIGLLNIGILSIGVYLGWRHLKGQESAQEALIVRQQAEYDAAQLRREQEEREQRQMAQLRREQEEREQRQMAQLRREQEERLAAQILTQCLINGNANGQRTDSDWDRCLRSVMSVGGGEGARQVQVYEDEMIRQRARQGMPLW